MRSTKAIINLAAIRHNLSVIRQLAPKCKVMAVVKADAYGHGIVQAARSLETAEAIAVACMDEAIKLREAQINQPIILLEGFFGHGELQQTFDFDLQTVVHQQRQIEAIMSFAEQYSGPKRLTVWLKQDSGMNRLGFETDEFLIAYNTLRECPLVDTINLMSHMACADDISSPMNQQQIESFKQLSNGIEEYTGADQKNDKSAVNEYGVESKIRHCERSMANSAGIIAWPESHFDWIRPGIALYGCSPLPGYNGLDHKLIPAMTLQSQLFAIRNVKAGDRVGYGAAWRAKASTRIGVIAIGYGDGYPRHAGEGTPVWINGKNYPMVGKVSMDMLTVDLGNIEHFNIGDEAILWGKELPVETIAKHADTIPYTLLCGVTSRVRFEWIQ